MNIGLKLILMGLYLRLTKANQNEGFFAIDEEQSINEVDEGQYLANRKTTALKSETKAN